MTQDQEWLTVQEAADYLRVHVRTLRRWAKLNDSKPVPYSVNGVQSLRYRRSELDAFLTRQESR